MTPYLNSLTAASHFLSKVLLSTIAVEGAKGSKGVEFEFGERMSHLRSVREAYEERKLSSLGIGSKHAYNHTESGFSQCWKQNKSRQPV